MIFRIEHETTKSIRIRSVLGAFSQSEAEVLSKILSEIRGVTSVQLFRATGGIRLEYDGQRDYILEKISGLDYRNVTFFARTLDSSISTEEIHERKLSPELKRRLRIRILAETAADIMMPVPVQIGYHLYQMITLKNL